jgi:hypothetical protein
MKEVWTGYLEGLYSRFRRPGTSIVGPRMSFKKSNTTFHVTTALGAPLNICAMNRSLYPPQRRLPGWPKSNTFVELLNNSHYGGDAEVLDA